MLTGFDLDDAPRWRAPDGRLLYVAGKRSLRVYDVERGHRILEKIKLEEGRKIRGIAASAQTRRLYLSYDDSLACLDLTTHRVLWIRRYDSGADRMAITPDGSTLYLPSGFWTRTPYWYVIDAHSGAVRAKIDFHAGAHNTIVAPDGRLAYLASRRHNWIAVVSTRTNQIIREVGPFSHVVRPFTINADQSLVFANVDDLLGFEVADLASGKVLHRVPVQGYAKGPVERHHCPSHGIGMTPDGEELWVVDAHNRHLHVFDLQKLPPVQIESIALSEAPYWISFDMEGRYAYPSTGDVIDVKSRQIVATLRKHNGKRLHSEKMLQIDFEGGIPVRVGDQFGIGRPAAP